MKCTVHIDGGSSFVDGCNDTVIILRKVCVIFCKIAATRKAEYCPFTCICTKGGSRNGSSQFRHRSIQHAADVLCNTGRFGFFGSYRRSNRYLGITRCRNDCFGIFVSVAAIYPQIPRTCRGECDRSTGVGIGGYAACFAVKLCSVVNGIIGNVKEDRIVCIVFCSFDQLDLASRACFCGICMSHIAVAIGKVMESVTGILIEIPARKAGKANHVAGLQHDLIRGRTPARTRKWVLTIQIVVEVLILTEKPALEIRTAGCTRESYIAPISTVKLLVGINDEL